MRIVKLSCIAGLLALTVGALAALAHVKSFSSAVNIDSAERISSTKGRYAGDVSGGPERCQKFRTVQVWHDSNPPFKIGTTVTNAQGKWRKVGPAPPDGDEVYTVATRKTLLRNGAHRHRCRTDFSPEVTFPSSD